MGGGRLSGNSKGGFGGENEKCARARYRFVDFHRTPSTAIVDGFIRTANLDFFTFFRLLKGTTLPLGGGPKGPFSRGGQNPKTAKTQKPAGTQKVVPPPVILRQK